MDPSSLQQHQEIMSSQRQSVEKMIGLSKAQDQRKPKPQAEEALKCPRCDSTNTKFCYYNNYSLSQPRYFCKSCRRYWTKGGTLRNVPVGGGCRKTKRSSSSSSSKRGIQDHQFTTTTTNTTFSSSSYDHSINDNLSLALARLQNHPCTTTTGSGPGPLGLGLGFDHDLSIHYDNLLAGNINPPGFLDAFRSDGLQSMQYCGGYNGNVEMGEVVDNGGEMMIPYDHGRSSEQSENNNNRTFWGLPWQLNNGDHIDMGGLESAGGRTSWNNNGFSSTYWHGLLNSPLM